MSEGPQGVQGEQGVRGLQGPGGGEPGAQGEQGKRGEPGPLSRNVIASFLAVIVVATVVTGVNGCALKRLDQEIAARCEDGRINRVAIRSTILDGLASLGYRYDAETDQVVSAGPPIDYYATREAELRDALARSKAALARFPIINCK